MADFNLDLGQGSGSYAKDEMALLGDLLKLGDGLFGGGTNSSTTQSGSSETDSSQKGKGQTIGIQTMLEQLLTQATTNSSTDSSTDTTNNTSTNSSGSQNSTGGSNTSGNQSTDQTSANNTNQSGTVTKGNAQSNAALADLITQLQSAVGNAGAGFTKADAIADSEASVTAAINEILNGGIGSVFDANNNTGAYNSTTQAGLANDLAAKASAAGTAVQQKAITDYASIEVTQKDQAAKNLLSSVLQASDGNVTTTQNSTESGSLNQNTNSSENATNFENTLNSETSNTVNTGTSNTTENTSSTTLEESLQQSSNQSNTVELQEQEGNQTTNTNQKASSKSEEDTFFEGIF